MSAAHDELKEVFAELDQATDRALRGLDQVRASALSVQQDLPNGAMFRIAEIGLAAGLLLTGMTALLSRIGS